MQKEFLDEIITLIVGKSGKELVDLLSGNKNVNEFLIAKKLDLTINQTRNLLYKLSDYGLVSSTRKKDKKKGWYTYFWTIENLKAMEFLKAEIIKKTDQLSHQIKSRETKLFYICNRCNIEFNEENALLNDFTCSECGEIFTVKDNSKLLRELKKNYEKLKSQLELLDKEIEKEKETEFKKKDKEKKKEEKKVAKEKKKIRDSRKLLKQKGNQKILKKKEKKKSPKKIAKKKTKKTVKKKSVKKISKKLSSKRKKPSKNKKRI